MFGKEMGPPTQVVTFTDYSILTRSILAIKLKDKTVKVYLMKSTVREMQVCPFSSPPENSVFQKNLSVLTKSVS